jgi:hypothetical protein
VAMRRGSESLGRTTVPCAHAQCQPCATVSACPSRPLRPGPPPHTTTPLLQYNNTTTPKGPLPPTCTPPVGDGWGINERLRIAGTGHRALCASPPHRPPSLCCVATTHLRSLLRRTCEACCVAPMQASCHEPCLERKLDLHISKLCRPVVLLAPLGMASPCQDGPIAPPPCSPHRLRTGQKERARVASAVPVCLSELCTRRRVAMHETQLTAASPYGTIQADRGRQYRRTRSR